MADPKLLELLKTDIGEWNRWRKDDPFARVDLRGANLSEANLIEANLRGANLRKAKLTGADLYEVYLSEANLSGADLSWAKLIEAHLSGADLSGADLGLADLSRADLSGASLIDADLGETNLGRAILTGANLGRCVVGKTIFANVDLSQAKGLDTIQHRAPSTIGLDTIYRSKGQIPEVFLRGAGVPDSFITFMRSLVIQPIEFYSCFISYSSKDDEFARRLHTDLQASHVRCWFAPEDLRIGDRFRDRIDESIRVHDKLLLVLSANSIDSPWVRREVEAAFEREDREKRLVLFPIRLDNAVMETTQAWAAEIRQTRQIGDFFLWKDHDHYKKSFDRLLRDLSQNDQKP